MRTSTVRRPRLEALEDRLQPAVINLPTGVLNFYARFGTDNQVTVQLGTHDHRPAYIVTSHSSDGSSFVGAYSNLRTFVYWGSFRSDVVEVGSGYLLSRLQLAATREDGECAKDALLSVGEQVVTPGDGRSQRLLSDLGVPAALKQIEAIELPKLAPLSRRVPDPEIDGGGYSIDMDIAVGDGTQHGSIALGGGTKSPLAAVVESALGRIGSCIR